MFIRIHYLSFWYFFAIFFSHPRSPFFFAFACFFSCLTLLLSRFYSLCVGIFGCIFDHCQSEYVFFYRENVCSFFVPYLCRMVLCVLHKVMAFFTFAHPENVSLEVFNLSVWLWWITAVNLTFLANLQRPLRLLCYYFQLINVQNESFASTSIYKFSRFQFIVLCSLLTVSCIHSFMLPGEAKNIFNPHSVGGIAVQVDFP